MWIEIAITSLLTVITACAIVFLKHYIEVSNRGKEDIWAARRKLYMDILDPYITIFAEFGKGSGGAEKKALNKITSLQYRKSVFEIKMIGSDNVIRAMNDFKKCASRAE